MPRRLPPESLTGTGSPVGPALSVLVVDDEPLIRTLLDAALRQLGVAAHLAANGEEAVALYRQHGQAIDVVLCDVRMPGLDGVQTLTALRGVNPQVRCCFMTAQSGQYSRADLLNVGAARVFFKPFGSLMDLVQELREVAGAG